MTQTLCYTMFYSNEQSISGFFYFPPPAILLENLLFTKNKTIIRNWHADLLDHEKHLAFINYLVKPFVTPEN